jgi:SAM-dependent methyltransferase
MNAIEYWDKQHIKYSATDWIDKPTIFAEWALEYLPANGKLLDLGAGQGQDSRYFADKGFSVTATDFSDTALQIAKEKSPQLTSFQKVDLAQVLPLEDSSFDVVYSHLSLHYFDQETTKKLFSEIYRILKPGGILAALFNSDQDLEMSEGTLIEPDFLNIDGIKKRYFSPASARSFADKFEIIIADNDGTTYKDRVKGVNNLIRLICRKPNEK